MSTTHVKKYVRIKKTARSHKGKKATYDGETIYPNSRHAVNVLLGIDGSHGTHGGYPAEFNLDEVEFLFDEQERKVTDLRDK
jgi:hypothetical protein